MELSPRQVMGGGLHAVAVAAGADHTCVLDANGQLWCVSISTAQRTPLSATPRLPSRRTFGFQICCGHGEQQAEVQLMPLRVEALAQGGHRVHLLAAGRFCTLVLNTAGLVLAWGRVWDANGAETRLFVPSVLQPPLRANERVRELCASRASHTLALVTDGGRLLTLSRGVGWAQRNPPQ